MRRRTVAERLVAGDAARDLARTSVLFGTIVKATRQAERHGGDPITVLIGGLLAFAALDSVSTNRKRAKG